MSNLGKKERLDKYLANLGLASRRNIRRLLLDHEIMVNGKRILESGIRIDPLADHILYDGVRLKKHGLVYYLLYKPKGVISTTADEHNRKNVISLIDTHLKIYPVGRLDKDTSGLLILTNDGDLTHKLTHPKFHVDKVYELTILGDMLDTQLKALREGVLLEDGITYPAEVQVIKKEKGRVLLQMTIHEGRNRQIRRMCETVGLNLQELKRIKFGQLTLQGMKEGKYRMLTKGEVEELKKLTGRKNLSS